MAYCRWSSQNGYCDAYVYEHEFGGWVTHLAGRRWPPGAPCDPLSFLDNAGIDRPDGFELYMKAKAERADWNKKNPRVIIQHPAAGQSYLDVTPSDCADRLLALRGEGFVIPQEAIDLLRSEVMVRA